MSRGGCGQSGEEPIFWGAAEADIPMLCTGQISGFPPGQYHVDAGFSPELEHKS